MSLNWLNDVKCFDMYLSLECSVFCWCKKCHRKVASRLTTFQYETTIRVQLFLFIYLFCFIFLTFYFTWPGVHSGVIHLFSHEAQGSNVPNSLTVGINYHCSYVPSITQAMGGSYSVLINTSIEFGIVEMDNWLKSQQVPLLGLDPWPFHVQGKPMNRWTMLPLTIMRFIHSFWSS